MENWYEKNLYYRSAQFIVAPHRLFLYFPFFDVNGYDGFLTEHNSRRDDNPDHSPDYSSDHIGGPDNSSCNRRTNDNGQDNGNNRRRRDSDPRIPYADRTFQGYEWGDYLHVSILDDQGTTYDFFVLKYPGVDVETLSVGQKVKVTWQNCDEYLDPPGENVNVDKVLNIELIG